jgi:ABC-type multidrug transport system ATPase subunit
MIEATSPGSAPRLSVRNLASRFAGGFNFDVRPGECVVIQGASGAGKSVLLRMLADLDPHTGTMSLDGHSSNDMAPTTWRARVIYQPAEPAWWETVAAQHFSPAQLAEVRAMLPAVGLGEHALDTDVTRLSTGERQRLALLRSLVGKPDVLLLDEPTAALDPATVAQVEGLLQSFLARGMSLLVVTHSPEQAKRLAHRIWYLEEGTLKQQ